MHYALSWYAMQYMKTTLSTSLPLHAAGLHAKEKHAVFSLPDILLSEGKKAWVVCNFCFSFVKTWLAVESGFLSFHKLQSQSLTLFSSSAVCK